MYIYILEIIFYISQSTTITCVHVIGSYAFNNHKNLKLKVIKFATHKTPDPINFGI